MILLDLLITLGSSTWTATDPGWKYCDGPLGVHTFVQGDHTTYRLSAGVLPGGGTVTLDSITITGDRPRCESVPLKYQTRTDTALLIAGPITIPPRGSLVLDVAFNGATTWNLYHQPFKSDRLTYGQLVLPLPTRHDMAHSTWSDWNAAVANGQAPTSLGGEGLAGTYGHWFVYGNKIGNEGGFNSITVLPMTPDFGTVLLGARGARNRHWVDCLDAATGEPVPTLTWDDGYNGVGFSSKSGTLPAFWEPLKDATDPSKVQPKRWRGAKSSYEDDLMGARVKVGDWISWEGGYVGHDTQHLVRVIAPLVAAAQLCGDPCSAFDLRCIANDVGMIEPAGAPLAGAGSTYFGTRASAWTALAFIAAGVPETITAATAKAQMGNGCTSNFGYSPWLGFNPSPWLPGEAVPVPLPQTIHVAQGMEQEFAEIARMAAGRGSTRYLDNVYLAGGMLERYKAPVRLLGFRPKWLGVAHDHAPTGSTASVTSLHRRVVQTAGVADYGPWHYIGVGALNAMATGNDPEPWFAAMLLVRVDGHAGKAPDLGTLLAWLRTSYPLRYVATAAIAALEMRKL